MCESECVFLCANMSMLLFRFVASSNEAPLWVWTPTFSCGNKTQSSCCKVFHSSLSCWASGQPNNLNITHTCTRCLTCLDFQTSSTGIPAMIELGSSWAAEFTVSLAPITRTRSVSDRTHKILYYFFNAFFCCLTAVLVKATFFN